MIKEIICDKIVGGHITFHNGLNVVVGDDNARNSIGKSSALLLVDFAFGGHAYIHREDLMTHVGHHDVRIHFVFNRQDYYFVRGTLEASHVHVCNESYRIIETITEDEYCKRLSNYYRISDTGLSFRMMLCLYSRIYGLNNYDENRPLYPGFPLPGCGCIENLVMLFNMYKDIKILSSLKKEANTKYNAYRKVVEMKLVSVLSKDDYKASKKNIDELNCDLENLKTQILTNTLDLTSEQLRVIGCLKRKLARIQREKSFSTDIIEKLENNMMSDNMDINMGLIKKFFPNSNLKKIEEVDTFHKNLTKILHDEITTHLKLEKLKLDRILKEEEEVIGRITNVADNNRVGPLALDRLVSVKHTIDDLISGKNSYEIQDKLLIATKQTNKQYKMRLESVLAQIQQKINNEMAELTDSIYGKDSNAPMIQLKPSSYKLNSKDDTGAGTNWRALITFDLAVFNLTELPFLIHDSHLFKNIGDEGVLGIIKVYSVEHKKQIFISLDKVQGYPKEVQQIVSDHQVIKITDKEPLFGFNWNKKKQTF